MKIRLLIMAILVAILSGSGCKGCDSKSTAAEDPLKKIARQRYNEGRRLFLTCDPNNFPTAIKMYDDALSSWEDYPDALAAWAEAVSMWYGFRITQNMFEEAYVKAQRAIRLAPESDAGYRAMADLFRHYVDPETGKPANAEALQSIEHALKINPTSAENLYVKGSILLATDPEAAIKALEEALRNNRDLGKIFFNLASAHQIIADRTVFGTPDPDPAKQEELQAKAEEHYKRAIQYLETYNRMVPGDLGGFTSLANIYIHKKMYAEAETLLQQTVSKNITPDPSQAQWRSLAYVYLAQIADKLHNDLNLSRTYLERALNTNPYDSQVYEQLIRIATIQKDDAAVKKYTAQFEAMIAQARAEQAALNGSTTGAEPGGTAAPAPGGTAAPAPGTTTIPAGGAAPVPPETTPAPALPGATTPPAPAAGSTTLKTP